MSRARNWFFTWNNPGDDARAVVDGVDCRFCIYQLEQGESGTPHFQGLFVFNNARRLSALKDIAVAIHWEPCRNLRAAIKYCSKEEGRLDGPWERGDRPEQGKRTDLLEVGSDIVSGRKRVADIAIDRPDLFIKYHRGLQLLEQRVTTRRTWQMEVMVYHGTTGSGKTRTAFEEAGDDAYWKPKGEWWDGYSGHENVIIDEFAHDVPITTLLRWLDRYPLQVPIKGGFAEFAAKRVWITSNIDPDDWYPDARDEHRAALRRRFTNVKRFVTL